MLTQVDTQQPEFEETTLVPPMDLVCVPDQGRFPCLSEGPHPTLLGPHRAGSEACRAKSGWEQFENYATLIIYSELLRHHFI